MLLSPDRGEHGCSSCRGIEVEAGIDAEGCAIVEETAPGTFGVRQYLVGLLQRQRRKGDRQQVSGLGSKPADVLHLIGVLGIDDR